MKHIIVNHSFVYEIEKLIRVFYPDEKVETSDSFEDGERYILTAVSYDESGADLSVDVSLNNKSFSKERVERIQSDDYQWQTCCERHLAILLFNLLCKETSYIPPWGILTGIRPSKLMSSFCKEYGDEKAKQIFKDDYLVSPEKTELAYTVAKNEEKIMAKSKPDSYSLYVSIPFCPSRCSYCSFVSQSNEQAKKLIPEYIEKLVEELKYTSELASRFNLTIESVYFGGGTPTALKADELKTLTDAVEEYFHPERDVEYTIESGRPDSITKEKLDVISNCGARRISINPQTFNDDVLRIIGRKHDSKQTVFAMNLANNYNFSINMDLIAGLPGDSFESFENTLDRVLEFKPENITVHTLALKRSSNIVTESLKAGEANTALKMLNYSSERLTKEGYIPYYMYRQSKCLGNLENVGWTKPGYECEYNIQMMEETHTVLAVGAGAVSKLKNSEKIERIFNFKYPFEYIGQFEEIIKRKEKVIEFYSD